MMLSGKRSDNTMWRMIGVAWELGYLIALPLVGLALLGKFVDRLLGTSPLFLLIGILAAIDLSTIIVVRKVSGMMDDEKDLQKSSKKQDDNI